MRRLLLWFYKLTGGRPMTILYHHFWDEISGKPVYMCKDGFGRLWMANNCWGWFRVRPESERCKETQNA